MKAANERLSRTFAGAFLLAGLALATSCHTCPESCDDSNLCTTDSCSKETGFACQHTAIVPCDGDAVCQEGEFGRSSDCPTCDDDKSCTTDTYDVVGRACGHELQVPCCGNGLCDPTEGLYECVADCRDGMPKLEPGKSYKVSLNDRFQFEMRQIDISSIWDNAIVASVILDTQSIGARVDRGQMGNILGVGVRVDDVSYDIDPARRSARISLFRTAPPSRSFEAGPDRRQASTPVAQHVPVISDLTFTPGSGTVRVSWALNEDADGIVNWGDTLAYGDHISDFAFTRSHSIVIPIDEPGEYFFAIRSCSGAVRGVCTESKGLPLVVTETDLARGPG